MKQLYGEQPKEDVVRQRTFIQDVDGQQKLTLYGSAHYANHLWWRVGVTNQCANRLTNLTYIRTADSYITHLLRPLFAGVHVRDWPRPVDMHNCIAE